MAASPLPAVGEEVMSWGWGEGQGSSLGSQMAHASPSQSYATANQILTLLRLRIPGSGKQGYRQNLSSRSVVKQKANAGAGGRNHSHVRTEWCPQAGHKEPMEEGNIWTQ